MIEGPRIFRYVVRQDRGGSPDPFHGWCSLAVCKPQIRRSARVGDWILGLRSRHNDQVIYAMRLDEVMSLGDYWADSRFIAKRSGGDGPPDNFYREVANGVIQRVANALHDEKEATRDIAGLNALVSCHFWYFGGQSPTLPTELVHLVHSGQGHALQKRRQADDVEVLQQWLAHWPMGRNGAPLDAWRPRVIASKRA